SLHSTNRPLCLEVRVSNSLVQVGSSVSPEHVAEQTRAILGASPHLEVRQGTFPLPSGRLRLAAVMKRPNAPFWAPLQDVRDLRHDSLVPVLEAVQPLREDEQLLIRLLTRPATARQRAALVEDL